MTGRVLIALLILAGGVLPARAPAFAQSFGAADGLWRLAKLYQHTDTSHPFFWAPVVLVGDGGPTGP